MLVAIPKFQEGGGPSELSAAFKVVMSLETPERVGYYSPSQNTEFLSVVSVIEHPLYMDMHNSENLRYHPSLVKMHVLIMHVKHDIL